MLSEYLEKHGQSDQRKKILICLLSFLEDPFLILLRQLAFVYLFRKAFKKITDYIFVIKDFLDLSNHHKTWDSGISVVSLKKTL